MSGWASPPRRCRAVRRRRVKLAAELQKRSTGRTIYILDEPTTGLHFDDIRKLLSVINGLVDKGNTVIVIEHNLDVIKTSDWIVDMGPEGGAGGGNHRRRGHSRGRRGGAESYTGKFLAEVVGRAQRARSVPVGAAKSAPNGPKLLVRVGAPLCYAGKFVSGVAACA